MDYETQDRSMEISDKQIQKAMFLHVAGQLSEECAEMQDMLIKMMQELSDSDEDNINYPTPTIMTVSTIITDLERKLRRQGLVK